MAPSPSRVAPVSSKSAPQLSQRGITRALWGAAAMLGVLGMLALLSYSYFERLARANEWRAHTYQVLLEIGKFRQANTNLENRLRGFALIGDPRILRQVSEFELDARRSLQELRVLTQDNAAQQKRLGQITRLKRQLTRNYLDKYLRSPQSPAFIARQIRLQTGRRRALWLSLADEAKRFEAVEQTSLQNRAAQQEIIEKQAARAILGGSTFALLAALGLIALLGRTARAYQNAAISLEQSNDDLRVQFEEKLLAEERLRASESLFRQIAEDSHDLICLHAPNGRFAYVSPAARAMLGFEPRDLVGRDPLEFFVSEGEENPRAFLEKMQDAPTVRRFRHPQGHEVFLETIAHALDGAQPLGQGEGAPVLQWHTISRDVSARVRDEEKRARFFAGLQSIIEATDELLLLAGEETILRRGVELAREKLGVERSAIFLTAPDGLSTRGAFGTNRLGQTTREDDRVQVFALGWRHAPIHPPLGARKIVVRDLAPFWGVKGGENQNVPWMGATLISSLSGDLGVLFHDALESRVPYDAAQHELLAIYCQILGALLERERTQTRLKEQQRLLHTVIEHAPLMLYSVNRAGQFVLAQGRALERIGFSSGEGLLGKTPEDLLGSDSESSLAIRRALLGEVVHTVVQYNNSWLEMWREPIYDQSGDIEGAIGVGFDVSERVQAETELREALELQKAVVDGAAYAIFALDQNHILRVFNRAAEKMLGYDASEVVGQFASEFLPRLHLPEEIADFAREVERDYNQKFDDDFEALIFHQQRVLVSEREWTFVRKDGTQLPVRLTGQFLSDETGKMNGYVGIAYDLTESRRAEKLKNEFVSVVSHELRTPLTAIRGSLGLMQGGVAGPLPPAATQMIDIATKNVERLVFLINDILDIEKIESGHLRFDMVPLTLRELLENAAAQNRDYGQTLGVSIELEPLPAELKQAQIEGDAQRLMQVLANLLSNACKFTPPGTGVSLRARPLGACVRVEVQDKGEGVPIAFEKQLFERFAQADSSATRQKGGTGLGLAIARAIIEKHGGKIGYLAPDLSQAREGATFYFDLPLKGRVRAESATAPRLLVCEDDPEVTQLLETILRRAGYQISHASDIARARELIQSDHFSALLLDIELPDGNGLDWLHELRADERFAELPVIVVSAHCREGLLHGNALSVLDWLQKPVEPKQLLSTVAQTRRGGQARVLHVEDDPDVRRITQLILRDSAHIVAAETLGDAREALQNHFFDLALLDLGLPDGNGLDLVPLLNSQTPPVPVVIFSAREGDSIGQENIAAHLTKSRTSNAQLRQTIEHLLRNET